jgi:hypothetical protein
MGILGNLILHKRIVKTEQGNQNNKTMREENKNNTLFFYLGAFFVMTASLSIGVILIFFLIKLGGTF